MSTVDLDDAESVRNRLYELRDDIDGLLIHTNHNTLRVIRHHVDNAIDHADDLRVDCLDQHDDEEEEEE